MRSMTTNLSFDNKRKLLSDGTTEAWGSVEERLKFMYEGGEDENSN